jgi:hypothetical protein
MPTVEYQWRMREREERRKEMEKRTKRTKNYGDFEIIYR